MSKKDTDAFLKPCSKATQAPTPRLGSVLHRIGVGLDAGRIKTAGENNTFRRSATAAETKYFKLMSEKRVLNAKKLLLKKKRNA